MKYQIDFDNSTAAQLHAASITIYSDFREKFPTEEHALMAWRGSPESAFCKVLRKLADARAGIGRDGFKREYSADEVSGLVSECKNLIF